jgi:predicted nucleic acid-binding protein
VDLVERLGPGPIAVDTAVFIYLIAEHPRYLPVVLPLFEGRELVTSALTLLEVLVVPLRAGDLALARRYEAILTRGRGLRLIDLDRSLLRAAAQIRAVHQVRTPDALQLAAGLMAGATSFVGNDRRLPAIPGLPVLVLDDYI